MHASTMSETPLDPFDLFVRPGNVGDPDRIWRIEAADKLVLDDGNLVVCDPLTGMDEPLQRSVAPGRYRVELAIADHDGDERVGAARLVFRDARPVKWELAARVGERVDTLREGQRIGYGVDSGVGCFAAANVEVEGEQADALVHALEANMRPVWTHAGWPNKRSAALVAFSAGYGDGVYASYWGLDADDAPVCLITDFGLLKLAWPEIENRPEVRSAHLRTQMALLRTTPGFDGYALAQEIGAFGEEAREFAGEMLGMMRDPARTDASSAIRQALSQIAREAPEVAELAAEMWSPGDAHAPAYLSIVLNARQLSARSRELVQRIATDGGLDDDQREAALRRLVLDLDTGDGEALLDALTHDASPTIRSVALSELRESEPRELWASRVERAVGDRSAEVRKKLAHELGARSDEVKHWIPVLAPMLADIDEAVRVAAACALAWSETHWHLAADVFAQTLAQDEHFDEMGNSAHASVLWALAQGRVPKKAARAIVAPHRTRLSDYPALVELFSATRAGKPRAKQSPRRSATPKKKAKAATKKRVEATPKKRSAVKAVAKRAKPKPARARRDR